MVTLAVPRRERLGDELAEHLSAHGPVSASRLAKAVAAAKRTVLEVLSSDTRFERVGRGSASRWRLAGAEPAREPVAPTGGGVVEALDRELAGLERRVAGIAGSPLAATARVLAGKLDDPDTSASAAAAGARQLRELLEDLRELVPSTPAGGALEAIAARVAARRNAPA